MSTVGGGQKLAATITEKVKERKIKEKLLEALENDVKARDMALEKFGGIDGGFRLGLQSSLRVAYFGRSVSSGAQNFNKGEEYYPTKSS